MQAMPNLHSPAALKTLEREIAGYLEIFGRRDSDVRQSRLRDRPIRRHLDALRRTGLLRQTSQNGEAVPAPRGAETKSAHAIFCGPGKIDIRLLMGTAIGVVDKIYAKMSDSKHTGSNDLICGLFDHAGACLLSVATDAAGPAAWSPTFIPPAVKRLRLRGGGLSRKARDDLPILPGDLLAIRGAAGAHVSDAGMEARNRRFRIDPEIDALLGRADPGGHWRSAHERGLVAPQKQRR